MNKLIRVVKGAPEPLNNDKSMYVSLQKNGSISNAELYPFPQKVWENLMLFALSRSTYTWRTFQHFSLHQNIKLIMEEKESNGD